LENFGDNATGATEGRRNQAWFEYQLARVARVGGKRDRPVSPADGLQRAARQIDAHGLGIDPIIRGDRQSSVHRSMHWGANIDLILTDNRSYRSGVATTGPEARFNRGGFRLSSRRRDGDFDAGEEFNGRNPRGRSRSTERRGQTRVDAPPLPMWRAPEEVVSSNCIRRRQRGSCGEFSRDARLANRFPESAN
jgi:hypothetical protein